MSDQDIERRIARDIAKWQRGVRDKGEPLQIDEGWLHTPQGLRLPFSVLKSAGVPPREVELLARRAAVREQLEACSDAQQRERLTRELSELEQNIAFRLEALQRLGRASSRSLAFARRWSSMGVRLFSTGRSVWLQHESGFCRRR